jgi:hypothetical protein
VIIALALLALAGWTTVVILLVTGGRLEQRIDRAHDGAISASNASVAQLNKLAREQAARIHQLEAIADAYRIEGLKNPGAVPSNVAPMGGELRELDHEYTRWLDGLDDPEARAEYEGYIRAAVLQNPDARPRDVIRGLMT